MGVDIDFYKSIIENSAAGYAYHKMILDEKNRPCDYEFIEVNQSFESLTGLKSSDIVGKRITEVLPAIVDSEFNWIDFFGEIALKGEKKEFEQFLEPLDSWYRVNAHSPKKGYFITIFSDISHERRQINELKLQVTQRKLAEDELRRFKIISDNALYGKAIADVDGKLVYLNKFFANIHGYAPEELTGQPISVLHTKKQLEKVDQTIASMLQGGKFEPQEVWHVHRNGTEFPMLMSSIVIRGEQNSPPYLAVSAVDSTETRKLQDELRANESRYIRAQELGKVGNWEYNLKTTKLWGSDEAKKMYGFDSMKDSFSLKDVENCIIERERVHQRLVDLIENSKPYNLEFDIIKKNTGKIVTFVSIAELEKDEDGKPLRVSGVIQDITDRKKAEEALRLAMQPAEAANEAKSQFLANMSHEIRTPINGFMGMIQLMQTTELTEEQQDFMRIAKSSTDRLLNVINNILDYSKIEAGKIQFEKTTFCLKKMIIDTIDLCKVSTKNTGLLIEASIENDVPDKLVGDSFRLNQIISNLMGNAVKFTLQGSINIYVKNITVQSNEGVTLEFVIKDTGIGIPPGKVDTLFKSFSQVNSSTTRIYGGSGLGLSYARDW